MKGSNSAYLFFSLNWAEQLLLVGALVATLLLAIVIMVAFFQNDTLLQPRKRRWLPDALTALTFLAFLGWTSVLAHLWIENLLKAIAYSVPPALIAALFPHWILRMREQRIKKISIQLDFKLEDALTSTGEVLQNIPPHQDGAGKVHLNLRRAPYELEAVTTGGALAKGVPVRVVDVINNTILVVEPLSTEPQPPDGGMAI